MGSEKVQLHVYDLSNGLARQLSRSLLGMQLDGIWHTGVVVGGIEYYFGGGIQRGRPGQTHFGRPVQVIEIGNTEVPHEIREELVGNLTGQFRAETYDLLSNNCNNFSNEFCNLLTGKGIPEHIVNLPDNVMNTPFGAIIRPLLTQVQSQLGAVSEGQSSMPSIPSVPAKPTIPPPSAEPSTIDQAGVHAQQDQDLKAVFEKAVRKEFDAFREQGLQPNEAATKALAKVKQNLLAKQHS